MDMTEILTAIFNGNRGAAEEVLAVERYEQEVTTNKNTAYMQYMKNVYNRTYTKYAENT